MAAIPVNITEYQPPSGNTSGLGQALAGFSQGLNIGGEISGAVRQGSSVRKANKIYDEADEFIDSGGENLRSQGVDADGSPAPVPTTRDLVAMERDLEKALRTAGDPQWAQNAKLQWADKLSKGYDSFVGRAVAAQAAGDTEGAAEYVRRGLSLIPNGQQYQFQTSADGKSIQFTPMDETTGEPSEPIDIPAHELHKLMLGIKDPATAYKLAEQSMAEGMKTRKEYRSALAATAQDDKDKAHEKGIEDSKTSAANWRSAHTATARSRDVGAQVAGREAISVRDNETDRLGHTLRFESDRRNKTATGMNAQIGINEAAESFETVLKSAPLNHLDLVMDEANPGVALDHLGVVYGMAQDMGGTKGAFNEAMREYMQMAQTLQAPDTPPELRQQIVEYMGGAVDHYSRLGTAGAE